MKTVGIFSAIALAAIAFALLAMLYTIDPTDSAWYPKCALYSLTGLHCPGCGGLRGMHQLLRGNFVAAIGMNALAFVVLPALAAVGLINYVRRLRHRKTSAGPAPRLIPVWTCWAVLILVVVFTIARNIPYEPFVYLAPG